MANYMDNKPGGQAKSVKFRVGTSGSGHHTEDFGNGRSLGGDGRQGPPGPNAGAGVLGARVTATWSNGMKNRSGKGTRTDRYSEG